MSGDSLNGVDLILPKWGKQVTGETDSYLFKIPGKTFAFITLIIF